MKVTLTREEQRIHGRNVPFREVVIDGSMGIVQEAGLLPERLGESIPEAIQRYFIGISCWPASANVQIKYE